MPNNRLGSIIKFYATVFLILGILLGFLAGFITGETLASSMQEFSYHYSNPWDKYSAPKNKEYKPIIRQDL